MAVSLVLVILVAAAGEVAGSMVGYLIGRKGGRAAVDRWGRFMLLTHKDLDRAEALGSRATASRWSCSDGSSRCCGPSCPSPPELAEMAFAKFVLFTVIGCARWCSGLTLLGYSAAGAPTDHVQKSFSYASYGDRRPGGGGRGLPDLAPLRHDAQGATLNPRRWLRVSAGLLSTRRRKAKPMCHSGEE